MRSHCKNNAIHCKINDVCIECAILYPNVDCVLLSYHCHTCCHTVVIPWASIWSLCRFCQFCRAVLSTNLPRRMCQANLPHVVIPVVIPLLSYLVVIPVVNRCCHTQGLCVEASEPDWHAAIYIYIYLSEVGGVSPTGKSFRFVRACARSCM